MSVQQRTHPKKKKKKDRKQIKQERLKTTHTNPFHALANKQTNEREKKREHIFISFVALTLVLLTGLIQGLYAFAPLQAYLQT